MTKSRMIVGALGFALVLSLVGNVALLVSNFWSMTHPHQVELLRHDFDGYASRYTIAHPNPSAGQ